MTQLALEGKKNIRSQSGFIVLMSVVLLSVIGVAITSSYLLLGLGGSLSGEVFRNELTAKYIAEACAEKALLSIKGDTGYAGSEQISYTEGSCEILPIENSSEGYEIKVQSYVGGVVKRVLVYSALDQEGNITINAWRETTSF